MKTLKIRDETHKRLKELRFDLREETFDGAISKLIDSFESKKKET